MDRAKQDIKILYIAGFGRNGGTILDRILGQIPGFFSLGEFRFVWLKGVLRNELCTCGVPFRECVFWKAVFNSAFGGHDETFAERMVDLYRSIDRSRYVPLLLSSKRPSWFSERLNEYVEALQDIFTAVAEESGCSVLVDSSKFAGYGLVLNMIPNADLYVVHLVRDSRATAFSWLKRKRKPEVWQEKAYIPRYSLLHSSFQWLYRNAFAEFLKGRSSKYMLVRYEDFARNPKEIFRNIMVFFDEPWRGEIPFTKDKTVELRETHTQSGNPSRFQNGEVEIFFDDAWKRGMSTWQKFSVTLVTWPLLARYGYRFLPFHINVSK